MSRFATLTLGLLAGLVALEIGLRIVGLVLVELEQRRNSGLGGGEGEPVTVLCLGESSTALGGDDAYPRQLEELLNEHGPPGRRFRVVNGGRPGIDSSVIIRDLGENLERWQPDIVTVMMGINDGVLSFVDLNQFRDRPWPGRLLPHLKIYRFARYLALALGAEDQHRRQERRLEEREEHLRRAIAERGDPLDSIVLAMLYRRQARSADAEQVLRGLLDRAPSARGCVDLAHLLHDLGRFEEEEALYRDAIARWPDYHPAYRWLIRLLGHLERDAEIEGLLRALVAAAPDAESYIELAKHYRGLGRGAEAEAMYREAMKVEKSPYAACDLAAMLREMGRLGEAERLLRKAERIEPGNAWTALELARVCVASERFEEAEQLLLSILDASEPRYRPARHSWDVRPRDRASAALELADLQHRRGDPQSARAVLERIAPNPMTHHNYQELVSKVLTKVGRLVAIQYPVRSVALLEAMIPERAGVVLVDNQRCFEDAIARDGYNALFLDHFASDFGHTKRRGHALIARNTARAILGEFYGVEALP